MAECQNSTSATRWVQSTDPTGQCITISITPDDFVSDQPEIVRFLQSQSHGLISVERFRGAITVQVSGYKKSYQHYATVVDKTETVVAASISAHPVQ